MAKKNKKVVNETKVNDERKTSKFEDETISKILDNENEKKSLCLSFDKKLKMRLKRQKKKEKKFEFESSKLGGELNVKEENLPSEDSEEAAAVINIVPSLSEDNNETRKKAKAEDEIIVQAMKNKFVIETIPEDLFEEFIENEEMVQTMEAIKACSGTKGSPKMKKRDPIVVHLPKAIFNPSPNILYNYHGVSYTEPDGKIISCEGFQEGVEEIYSNRILDVIMEESSEFSDASGASEKKIGQKVGEPFLEKTINVVLFKGEEGEFESVEPVIVKTVKKPENYKIELVESSTESDFENGHDKVKSISNGEINKGVKIQDTCSSNEKYSDDSGWSVNSTSSNSYRLTGEESESWRSSLNSDLYPGYEGDDHKAFSRVEENKKIDFLKESVGDKSTLLASQGFKNSWNSLNNLSTYEADADGLFHKKVFSKNNESDCVKMETEEYENNYPDIFNKSAKNEKIITNVNVKALAESMKSNIDEVLKSKLKLIKNCEEPLRNEKSLTKTSYNNKKLPVWQEKKKNNMGSSYSESDLTKSATGSSLNPEPLFTLAEKKVLTLPCGWLVLKKIGLSGCCSDNSEGNSDLEKDTYMKKDSHQKEYFYDSSSMSSEFSFHSQPASTSMKEDSSRDGYQSSQSYIEFDYSNPKLGESEKWYGMPTRVPAVLVGLSPSQKKVFEKKQNGYLPDESEAAQLLDLHQKFIERRSYHDTDFLGKRNVVFDTNTTSNVSITEINELAKVKMYPVAAEVEKVTEEKFAKQSLDKFESVPEIPQMRSEASEKSSSIKSRCCGKKDCKKENDESTEAGERNTQTNEESEVVGKSRLLALLQNAISDESILETNIDSSIKSSSESHEVSFVKSQETIMENQGNKKRMESACRQKAGSFESGHKTFQDFWKKEKNYCSLKEDDSQSNMRQNFRPKTICCEDEIELFISETKQVPKEEKEEETLILTQNLPSVFEVIKSFEKPNVTKIIRKSNEENNKTTQIQIDNEKYRISKKGDIAVIQRTPTGRGIIQKGKRKSMPASILSEEEIFKQKMYDEYMSKLAERIERRQQKVIKVSQSNEKGPEDPKFLDIENEFINKVKERKGKLGMSEEFLDKDDCLEKQCREFARYWEGEIMNLENGRATGDEAEPAESTGSKRNSVQLLSDNSSDVENLPKHLKELLQVEGEEFPDYFDGVWSPANRVSEDRSEIKEENEERKKLEDEPIPPVWTPKSAQASPILEKKEFRPVNFESPTLPRKKYIQDDKRESSVPPPWQQPGGDKLPEIAKSTSSPALSLPKAPNPTVTLLQKAREGHLPRGAHYLNSTMHESPTSGESTIEKLEIVSSSKSECDRPRNLEVGPKKIIGIGPTTKEGIPLVLRSEVNDENKEKWYKRMYDSLHKYGKDDDYVTVKYRTSPSRKGLYSSSSGYQSEPESINYERSTTPIKRQIEKNKENECISVTLPRSRALTPRRDLYKNQPGRIEDYEPGHSSISELETNKWWDEVLEIFDREEQKSRPIRKTESSRSFTNYASGYISDPQYVYKRSEDELQSPPSSEEQKEAYRIIQKGGEIPLRGLRKPAPERPKDNINTEIEYFPLTPTLTRIRVHKQNITPLSKLPLFSNPFSYKFNTLNYPVLPFGVCNSYSQVQIFPPNLLIQNSLGEAGRGSVQKDSNLEKKDQKFSVHLQNISGPNDYVQIVPKPRGQPRKSPIYANIPIRRSCSPIFQIGDPSEDKTEKTLEAKQQIFNKSGLATFSDLKRIAPSVNSISFCKAATSTLSKTLPQQKFITESEKPKKSLKKREVAVSKVVSSETTKSKDIRSITKRSNSKYSQFFKTSETDKIEKKELKKKVGIGETNKKSKKNGEKLSKLKTTSTSTKREKPLPGTSKGLKSLTETLKKKKAPESASVNLASVSCIKDPSPLFDHGTDINYVDLKNLEGITSEIIYEESEKEEAMSPIYEIVDEDHSEKPKVQSNMTEVFRSRSFSPESRKKIFKLPDMNKPIPPKRKLTRSSPALKMWSKMMVSYPGPKSNAESFDSNVKFLGNRIQKKLADGKDKSEFGDDIETVRTVKRNKSGNVSIETNRYVKLARPASLSSMSTRSSLPERRKLLPDLKTKLGSLDLLKSRKHSDLMTKSMEADPKKPKDTDTFVRSSTTYSVRGPTRKEDDKRKSVKVTVAISSKGKELLRKTAGVTTPPKKPTVAKSSTSSGHSVRSSASGLTRTSPFSDKGSTASSHEKLQSPRERFSPTLSTGRLSNYSRNTSPGSALEKVQEPEIKKVTKKISNSPIVSTLGSGKDAFGTKKGFAKPKEVSKAPKTKVFLNKSGVTKKIKKHEEMNGKVKVSETKLVKASQENLNKSLRKPADELTQGRDLVRTDSFFQNLFLRGPPVEHPVVEINEMSSVLERARRYQRRLIWPETYKSEPSLSLINFYLNQKRPVSSSRFKHFDRELYSSRSQSPLGSLHSENFQMKLRRFDSMSLIDGDSYYRDFSPEYKERSSSEPPLRRSPDPKSKISLSGESSARSSPTSSRSPSCRRIRSFRSSSKAENEQKRLNSRARSAGEIEEMKSRANLHGDFGQSVSSLNLSNLSDHTEYQAYVLELMHSTRKCERFRELHKFYSNLERMGKLEKTASTGDLRPRLKSEEIIDFDRWKKVRSKERAEAELKTLVDNLVKVQKEKDLLFRTADVEAIRWKGDRGLRIKEKSVEDLKEQFSKLSQEELEAEDSRKKELEARKDHYKPFWRGKSIGDVTNHLNNTLISYRGRPVTEEQLEKIQKTNTRIGKEYGYSLKAWSSLSSEQVDALKNQLSEIYAQDARKKDYEGSSDCFPESCEIVVPKDSSIKSSGESALHVRSSSALSKSQTYTPTIKRKEDFRKSLKKAESISGIPIRKSDSLEKIDLPQLPWKSEPSSSKVTRSLSEGKSSKVDRYSILKSKSTSSLKPFTESEKKRLSMTLSREVIEKMTKASGKGPLFPRETLGALAVAGSKLRDHNLYSEIRRDYPTRLTEQDKILLEQLKKAREFTDETENLTKSASAVEFESGSGSSETSIKTVIRKDSTDVLKKVQYFEELQHSGIDIFNAKKEHMEPVGTEGQLMPKRSDFKGSSRKKRSEARSAIKSFSSLENINDYFGLQRQYATSPVQTRSSKPFRTQNYPEPPKILAKVSSRGENIADWKNVYDEKNWLPVRYRSPSPIALRSWLGSSNESLFSCRSRSYSPDPTKYYRAYLKMVKCGAVRKLCNKFESWEDLLSLSSDRDFWLPQPRRFASDPELTRDMLRRFGTDPTKVTIRGQEVGDVRWLRKKFEKDPSFIRGRSRVRRIRSPVSRSPMTYADRLMPKINVISKTAELQQQGLDSSHKQIVKSPSRIHELPSSPDSYMSLIDYTKDHGGYYYTGEVEKLRRKFERLQKAEKLSILGQMYTSTPDVNELRDIAPYLECSWVAHRYPRITKATLSPEPQPRPQEPSKKIQPKPRPHSSSPVRPKQPLSILKPSYTYPDKGIFADQKFDPSIHRPKYRYQPEREIDQRYKRGDPDWWRHWNKPTVTFKESVSFKIEPEVRDLSPGPESPRKYVESEVTIHYKSPVRSEAKAMLSEDELARRQAESMKRIYKEERRRKYLQELQDMSSRRHTDNFTPSQKSPISLNRYDDFPVNPSLSYSKGREYTTDPVLVARGLYDFMGRRPRELAFRRGDIIFIIRKLDKNWCEGELNGMVGLFPLSYVEVIPYNEINMKYGRARAKYDFVPQTTMELSAHKGDMITLIRKIDENWFEGRIGNRTGIIPASYCHVLAMPQASRIPVHVEKVKKPVAAPAAHSLIHNGSGLSSKHYYTPYLSGPTSPGPSTASSNSANLHDGLASADMLIDEALMQLDEEFDLKRASKSSTQPLNVRINPRPEPALYQVLFNHVPNNDDELELVQGETVTVIEKCGDGWYIGSKTSDGKLGIFPGTHVRRIGPEFV